MKMFTQTAARNTTQVSQTTYRRLARRVALWEGNLHFFLQTLGRRLFVFYVLARVRANSTKGGAPHSAGYSKLLLESFALKHKFSLSLNSFFTLERSTRNEK